MINPYGTPPGHNTNPTVPVTLPGIGTLCNCDDCNQARQDWTNRQPPLLTELDTRDDDDQNNTQ